MSKSTLAVQLLASALMLAPAIASAQPISLVNVGTTQPGFRIDGADEFYNSGWSVSGAGDVNGDGVADVLMGALAANPDGRSTAGQAYLIFGRSTSTVINSGSLGSGGFAINGVNSSDLAGYSVSSAGDVNGDGLADVIVGAKNASPYSHASAGEAYVVFGKASTAIVNPGTFNSSGGGFRILGDLAGDNIGFSVSGAGDVNGDGLDDLIVGAPFADPAGRTSAGRAYVVFGKTTSTIVRLSMLNTSGFIIDGAIAGNEMGGAVCGAGDVNGDGLADVIIGAKYADPAGRTDAGQSYIVFGKTTTTTIDLAALGAGGFRVDGATANNRSGSGVAGAGDVNGDGYADLVIGAEILSRAYVIFGKQSSTTIDLASLGLSGFSIIGATGSDRFGVSVAGAGDLNGDGLADVFVGANQAGSGAGRSYAIFGKTSTTTINISTLGSAGFRLDGTNTIDKSGSTVSGAGDVNADGLPDLMIGAPIATANGKIGAGLSYVVFNPYLPFASGTYRSIAKTGNWPKRPVGISGDGSNDATPDSRAWIGFTGGSVISTQTVTLTRDNIAISNLQNTARVRWQVATNRVGFSAILYTFKYTDEEIAGLIEGDLKIYVAQTLAGPWGQRATTIDATRNTASMTGTGFSYFALSTQGSQPNGWKAN